MGGYGYCRSSNDLLAHTFETRVVFPAVIDGTYRRQSAVRAWYAAQIYDMPGDWQYGRSCKGSLAKKDWESVFRPGPSTV